MKIVLVSASPRRKKILSDAGLNFHTETVEISEIVDKNLNFRAAISQIATQKLQAFLDSDKYLNYKDYLVVTADTMVVIDDRILGKPETISEAHKYLSLLSGRDHSVLTAVCVFDPELKSSFSFVEESKVTFKTLSDQEIQNYISLGTCMDKAGAYGLQDETHDFVKNVQGSVNNVIGFPIEAFMKFYKKAVTKNENIQTKNYFNIKSEVPQEITKLIAVSKNQSSDSIENIYILGQVDFAENYVNEFVEKFENLRNLNIKWHFIGHLQTNKIAKVVGRADLIHSVDSEKVLKKIIEVASQKKVCQNILLQVKFGTETTKGGFESEQILNILKLYKDFSQIKILGLMTILPLQLSAEAEAAGYFKALKNTLIDVQEKLGLESTFNQLSMGMSDDFKLAISEGSTMIRIGTSIFGARL